MGWPQYAYLALTLLGLGFTLARHGKVQTDTVSFPASLISTAILFGLLYAGGFFG